MMLAMASGCAFFVPTHLAPIESSNVDVFELIAKGDLFVGTTKNFLPSRHKYLLKGTNGYLAFSYCDDYEWSRREEQWKGKTLKYDNNSRDVAWQLYDLNLHTITSGHTRVSYGGWMPDSGIPFEQIQKIINIQPIVQAGEFRIWNEVYRDYAWVTFSACNTNCSLSLAIVPDEKTVSRSLAKRLRYHDIKH